MIFCQKSWANCEAHLGQIWRVSSWISNNLCLLKFVHITWSNIFLNVVLKFCNIFVVGASQKKPFFRTRKMENVFLCNEKENFLCQHCPCFQDACLCTIWAHFNKLCHGCGYNTRHLARKPRLFVEDNSFLWTPFQYNYRIPSLLFLVDTRTYIMTPREGLTSFWNFLNFLEFSLPISKESQDGGHDRS
jgi:hypothetical protein